MSSSIPTATEEWDTIPPKITVTLEDPDKTEENTNDLNSIFENNIPNFDQKPTITTCMYCKSLVITSIRKEPGLLSLLMAGGVTAIFYYIPVLGAIPLCIKGLMDTTHICPACENEIGYYRKL